MPNAELFTAESGKIALELLNVYNPDLIFMDLQMPEMDGITATVEIRKKRKIETPIVALTADAIKKEKRHLNRSWNG